MVTRGQNADSIPTRPSLLEAVRDSGNDDGWRRFHDTYARLIQGVARSQGLSEPEAQEVVQDTMLSVARTMPDFQYEPARCSFKTWLLHLTRKRIIDHLRRRPRIEAHHRGASNDERRTPTIERIPDSHRMGLDDVWEDEWRNNLLECALQRLKDQVTPAQFQVFYLHVIKAASAQQVARALKVNLGFVYLAKHRLAPKFKRLVASLRREMGEE
jgi:RNA polymerase sigma factor (sigma-70 family)